MGRFSNFFYQVSSGWVTLIGLVTFLLFTILVLPGQSTSSQAEIDNADSPDMSFYYSAETLYEMAEVYGDSGRAAYIRARFTFDLIWPLVYTFFLTTSLSWILNRSGVFENLWRQLNLLPFFGMIFDYLENISTSLVMYRFPEYTILIDSLAGVFTLLKWMLIGASFLLLVFGAFSAIWSWSRSAREK